MGPENKIQEFVGPPVAMVQEEEYLLLKGREALLPRDRGE